MGILSKPAPEVDQPTYDVVGPIERYDMRWKGASRWSMTAGTQAYEEFYANNPQFSKEYDEELKLIGKRSREYNYSIDPVNEQFVPALFVSMGIFSDRDICVGKYKNLPTSQRPRNAPEGSDGSQLKIDPIEMSRKVKEFGKYLGAAKVRITKLRKEWVYSHYTGRLGKELEGKPVDDMDYEYVICMAVQHDLDMKKIGRGCAAEAEDGVRYSLASWMSTVMAEFIRCIGFRARSLPSRNAPYLVVPTFVDAGMGELGRNGLLITPEFGPRVRIAKVLTDLPLEPDQLLELGVDRFCQSCLKCATHCPSQSIQYGDRTDKPVNISTSLGVMKWPIDAEKCLGFWARTGNSCCNCIMVCPFNKPAGRFHNSARWLVKHLPWLDSWLVKGDDLLGYHKPVKPADYWAS